MGTQSILSARAVGRLSYYSLSLINSFREPAIIEHGGFGPRRILFSCTTVRWLLSIAIQTLPFLGTFNDIFLPKSHERAWQVVFSKDGDRCIPINSSYNGTDTPST